MDGCENSRKRKSTLQHNYVDNETTPTTDHDASVSNVGASGNTDVQTAIPPIRHSSTISSSLNDSVPRPSSFLFHPTRTRRYKPSPAKSFTASLNEFSSGVVNNGQASSKKSKRLCNTTDAKNYASSSCARSSFGSLSHALNCNITNSDHTAPSNSISNRPSVQHFNGTCPVTRLAGRINNEIFANISTSSLRPVNLLKDIGKWRLHRTRVRILRTKNIYTSENLRNATIRVRVSRMWDAINLKSNDVFGINMQLLDQMGGEIHSYVGPRYMPLFLGKLREGCVYDIGDFNIVPAGDRFLPVHKEIKIDFNALTTVSQVENCKENIPTHKCSFADHKTIVSRTDTEKYLTDVIGVLHHVGQVVDQTIGRGSIAPKREIILYLHCGTRIAATLWGNKTKLIDESAVEDSTKTIILTSMTVKNYQGKASLGSSTATFLYTDLDTTEGSNQLKSFRKRKLPAITDEDILPKKQTDVITDKCISEIISLDLPVECEGKIFVFEGKITGINLDGGWENLSCNFCKKGLGSSSPNNYCIKCDRQIENPLHRYRLELTVDDGSATVPIVLFDKLAEFILNQKAESLLNIQSNEVGGYKRVVTILNQLVGKTELFHAKLDTYTNNAGLKKMTATRISAPTVNISPANAESSTSKVQHGMDAKGSHGKGSARKKNRTPAA